MNKYSKGQFYSTIILSLGLTVATSSVSADVYFSCPSGYRFQVKQNAARCIKPAGISKKNLLRCGSIRIPVINKRIGHFYKKNYQGKKDMCVGQFKVGPITNTNAVDIACPAGYTKRITQGKDDCRKRIASRTIAPTKRVNR